MMCSSALSGGQAASTLPSSKYLAATRRCDSTMASTPAANKPMSCISGRSISSGEDGAGRFENPAQETIHEERRDAVSQPAGQHRAAVEFEILDLLQESVVDQKFRVALRHPHAAPDLRHQQAHVVIHADVGADAHRPRW